METLGNYIKENKKKQPCCEVNAFASLIITL